MLHDTDKQILRVRLVQCNSPIDIRASFKPGIAFLAPERRQPQRDIKSSQAQWLAVRRCVLP